MSDDWRDAEDKRSALRRVVAYRELQATVRRGARGSLFFGAVMLAIWYALFGQNDDFGVFSLAYLTIGSLEFAVGLWNRFAPSAEGVFFDGVVLLLFGSATLMRQYLMWQGQMAGRPSTFSLLFGAYWVWQGISHIRAYGGLRRAFAQRPTTQHIRWFDGLLQEIKYSDPETDDDVLDLPTSPRTKVKLLGDTAILVFPGSGETVIVAREDVTIRPGRVVADRDRLPEATLLIHGTDLGDFTLEPDNWRNYTRWKGTDGQPAD